MLRAWRLPAFCLPCENQVQTWHVSKCLVIRNLLHSLDGKEVSIPVTEAILSLKQSIF